MSETTIIAKIRPDGTVVEVLDDRAERPFPHRPMRPMTEEEISAAAAADPDARPMTTEQMQTARRGATLKELAKSYNVGVATVARLAK